MPAVRPRARRTTIREVLDTAIELEKKTMALYVGFVKAFPRPAEVRNFWFSMARHEAGHCGALALVEGILESDPHRAAKTRVWFDPSTATRLRSLLSAYQREARSGVRLERAFEMAIDLEASELEDVVVDMMKVVKSPEWRERAIQLLIHDLGDLSYMIERYTPNEALPARAASRSRTPSAWYARDGARAPSGSPWPARAIAASSRSPCSAERGQPLIACAGGGGGAIVPRSCPRRARSRAASRATAWSRAPRAPWPCGTRRTRVSPC